MTLMSNIDFNAVVSDVYDARGTKIDPAIGRGVYRDDTGELMSICGPNFVPVQHKDVVAPIFDKLISQGYDLEARDKGNRRDLYDLRGKAGAWVTNKTTKNGAVMRTEIITGDFVEVKDAYNTYGMSKGMKDLMFLQLSVLNSHDSTYAIRVNKSYKRIRCWNGMTQAQFQASAYGKHTMNFDVNILNAQVDNALDMLDEDQARFQHMATTKLTTEQAFDMVKKTFAKLPNKSTGEENYSEKLALNIMDRFKKEDPSAWGLYNAITAFQSHEDFRKNSNPVTAMIGREQKVASFLKSDEWNELLAI